MKKRKKLKLSKKERLRRSKQAKKNFKKIKRSVSKVAKKRRRKKSVSSNALPMLKGITGPVGSLIYGAFREKLSLAISKTKIAQMLPQTGFTDEALMLGVNFAAKKLGGNKIPILKNVITAQKSIEWSRVGEEIAKGNLFLLGGNNNNQNVAGAGQLIHSWIIKNKRGNKKNGNTIQSNIKI